MRLFPDLLRIEDYVRDVVAQRIPLADRACLISGEALFESLSEKQLYKNTS